MEIKPGPGQVFVKTVPPGTKRKDLESVSFYFHFIPSQLRNRGRHCIYICIFGQDVADDLSTVVQTDSGVLVFGFE